MADTKLVETGSAALAGISTEAKVDPGILNKLSKEKRDEFNHVAELRKQERDGKDPMEAFRNTLSRTKFGKDKIELTNTAFGGGEATINNGVAEIPDTASDEAKANFKKGKEINEKNSSVLTYTQVLKEAAREGKTVQEIYTKPPYSIRTTTEWTKQRNDALDALLKDGKILKNFGNELNGLSDPQKRDYIDEVLAKDPALNEAIITRMEEIKKTGEQFKPTTESEEKKKLDEDKTNIKAELDKNFKFILNDIGIKDATEQAAIITSLQPYLDAGADGGKLQKELLNIVLEKEGITSTGDINTYQDAKLARAQTEKQLPVLEKQIEDLKAELKTVGKDEKERKRIEKELLDKQREYNTAGSTFDTAGGVMDYLKDKTKQDDTWFNEKSMKLSEIRDKIQGEIQPDGKRSGGIESYTENLANQQKSLNEIDKKITDLPPAADADKEKAARLAAESDLLLQLEDVLSDSISEVLLKRHEELKDLEEARIKKAIEEATKAGDAWSVQALEKYSEALKTRYIDSTNKNIVTHKDTIRDDAVTLAHDGENGAKEIFSEITGMEDEAAEKDKIATELFSPPAASGARRVITRYSSLTDVQKHQADETYKQRVEKLNELFDKNKEGLEATIIKSVFAARGIKEKLNIPLGGGDFLNNNEWKMLQEKFSDLLTKGSPVSAEMKKVEEELQKKGVKLGPDSKLKWLMWALLGGLGAIGLAEANLIKKVVS